MNNMSIDAVETANELECFPYSVQHQDEGVCLFVRMALHRILLDFGLTNILSVTQNMTKSAQLGASPMPADLVLVSHAHPDHARGLLDLNQAFPLLPIYASEVTTKLLPLNWPEARTTSNSLILSSLTIAIAYRN